MKLPEAIEKIRDTLAAHMSEDEAASAADALLPVVAAHGLRQYANGVEHVFTARREAISRGDCDCADCLREIVGVRGVDSE